MYNWALKGTKLSFNQASLLIHTFSHIDLSVIISSAGFNTVECFDSVIPDSDMYRSKSVTFCIATKK